MGLINVDDPLPWHTWATVRLLLATKDRSLAEAEAQALLAPPSLSEKSSSIFRKTTRLLTDLGLLNSSDGMLSIADDDLAAVQRDDVESFTGLLRRAVFADEQNTDLTVPTGEVSRTGALDLNRALAWFLSLDSYAGYDLDAELARAYTALRPEAGTKALVNKERLPHFGAWSQFLGLARTRVVIAGGRGTENDFQSRIAPDCTIAVRSVLRKSSEITKDSPVPAPAVLLLLRKEIPVVPGGRHSMTVGIAPPEADTGGSVLSYALLRGQDEGWLALDRLSDSEHRVHLVDPDTGSNMKSISHITMVE
ncbi:MULTISPECIES: protein DpdG [Rhodococcus]|uniref:Protein DpdG n=1 Tax=Rhodococcus oxybenzonivorans TaxID=1990687 RepID=A0AAE4V167_9NOCA|nr:MULTISPECIES: protein DpdG [Rhodococcus]MDV7245326.1 protein DpdG [Rhodococcus oxybenzonivorans]MDV7266101.1 protein DpdG [Rhodococcus oxybenzonivorans]MDV7272394.1 protein DpdG [Rhodococcus oxybenzonivorans]MDV7336351.1 protein DpdG [Rhodococcus oxybenzonivorans]MDV7347651.1 protein DpdG [Rhodococcus oxybenzonivorans]